MAALRRLVDAALEAGGTAWNFVRDRRNLHLTAPMLSLPVVALLILRSRRPVVVRALSMAALLTLLEVRVAATTRRQCLGRVRAAASGLALGRR